MGFGFAAGASAETIKVKFDGDRMKDPVVASSPAANTTRVATLLSSRHDQFTYVDLAGGGVSEPYIRKKGDVNKRGGVELFVRSGHNDVVDTISVLTVFGGDLGNARTFFVNNALGDGLAAGIKCGSVKGGPGIRAYIFRLGNKGRWNRFVTPYKWKNGRLIRRGKKTKGKVALPPASETRIGCPKPATAPPPPPPPEKPPVLGSKGNRYLSGIGTVKPKSFRARQGTGRYFSFKWSGWGNARATARGAFNTGSPGAATKPMTLTAFDLGPCAGRKAYRKLTLKQQGGGGVTLGVC